MIVIGNDPTCKTDGLIVSMLPTRLATTDEPWNIDIVTISPSTSLVAGRVYVFVPPALIVPPNDNDETNTGGVFVVIMLMGYSRLFIPSNKFTETVQVPILEIAGLNVRALIP